MYRVCLSKLLTTTCYRVSAVWSAHTIRDTVRKTITRPRRTENQNLLTQSRFLKYAKYTYINNLMAKPDQCVCVLCVWMDQQTIEWMNKWMNGRMGAWANARQSRTTNDSLLRSNKTTAKSCSDWQTSSQVCPVKSQCDVDCDANCDWDWGSDDANVQLSAVLSYATFLAVGAWAREGTKVEGERSSDSDSGTETETYK